MALPNWYRKCVGCGAARNKSELLRIVKYKNHPPEIDLKQKKPGRGAYLCPQKECVLQAKKRHGLEKTYRCKIEPMFYDELLKQVEKNEF